MNYNDKFDLLVLALVVMVVVMMVFYSLTGCMRITVSNANGESEVVSEKKIDSGLIDVVKSDEK